MITIFGNRHNFRYFQEEGNVEETKEELTIDVIAGRIGAIQSLIRRIGMLSIPEALLDGIAAIMPFISLLSVQLKENCLHMGCCLGVKRCS